MSAKKPFDFDPRNLALHVLPAAQRIIWDRLSAVPEGFVLYGGTAIALQLGHRESVDFDFFIRQDFDPQTLIDANPLLENAHVTQMSKNTLSVRLHADDGTANAAIEPVFLSFFGVPKLPTLRVAHRINKPAIALGQLIELSGMKVMVVQKRAEAKDYLDIHALIFEARIDLPTQLAAALALYPPNFAPDLSLKALCYFAEGNLSSIPASIRSDLARAVRATDLQKLPSL